MINEPNKSIEETTLQKIGNLIKIPYYDLIEESHHQSPFIISGFQVLELDEINEELYQDGNIPDIEAKRGLLLKKKADIIENHYKSYSEEELSKVHCSMCYMNGFCKNELLYFRDKKHLISYLQYCFIFLKKSLFMNHTIYMNNRYDLFKIDQSYFIGFHFRIPKTICKSCFIQLINKEFLLSKLKNEISDYDESVNRGLTSPNKVTNLLKNKRKRKRKLSAIKTEEKEKEDIDDEKEKEKNEKIEQALKSIQITPIVIPLSNNETPKKIVKRRNVRIFGKKRRKKLNKIKNNKYNGNVVYDEMNNALIIQKNVLEDLEENKNIKNNMPINSKKIIDTKRTTKENKKEEQLKIGVKYKSIKFNNMKINRAINMNIIANKKEKSADKKNNTIIINKISNSKGIREINMNKVGRIQINNNDNNKKISNSIQNIYIPIDQLIPLNISLNPQKISSDLNGFMIWLQKLNQFCNYILQRMENNSICSEINLIRNQILLWFFITFEDIKEKINENRILIEYSLLNIKKNIEYYYQQINKSNENKINYKDLSNIQQSAYNIQEFYKFINKIILDGLQLLKDNIDEMCGIIIGRNNQNAQNN